MNSVVEAVVRLARWVFVRVASQSASQRRARQEAERARREAEEAERLAAELADIERQRKLAEIRAEMEL